MILITQGRVGTSHNEILALQMAARAIGWEVFPAPSGWRLDEEFITKGLKGFPYGSQTFGEVIAQQMGWTLKQNSFDWLAKLPPEYLKRKVEFMTLGEAKKITERKFIKPADDKCFDAKVYEPGEFQPHAIIQDDYPVLVSEPVKFEYEYRCFVAKNGRVLAWSNYIFHEHMADPKYWYDLPGDAEMRPSHFVEGLQLDGEHLGTVASVIDVGYIAGKGWAIIETNQAWASGLYGCDPIGALKVMEQSCE